MKNQDCASNQTARRIRLQEPGCMKNQAARIRLQEPGFMKNQAARTRLHEESGLSSTKNLHEESELACVKNQEFSAWRMSMKSLHEDFTAWRNCMKDKDFHTCMKNQDFPAWKSGLLHEESGLSCMKIRTPAWRIRTFLHEDFLAWRISMKNQDFLAWRIRTFLCADVALLTLWPPALELIVQERASSGTVPYVSMLCLHMTKSPRPSPSVFAYSKQSNTGGGNGLGAGLCRRWYMLCVLKVMHTGWCVYVWSRCTLELGQYINILIYRNTDNHNIILMHPITVSIYPNIVNIYRLI